MKTKKLLFVFLVVVFLGFLNGCPTEIGNGNVVSQERQASDFSGVTIEGVGNVNIYYAENYKVVVTTDSNIQDIITTKVNGNNLYIDEKNKKNFNPTKLIIDIYMPELRNINLNGVGDIKIISGKYFDFRMDLSGVGNIDAQNYEAENVVVTLSGTGDIKTWVTKSLTGKISGVGNVLYRGNPSINSVNRSGIGNVKRL
ncbi:MAG: DUF2807 domain-containing protein [Treponema sp.]|jgi:hypothetical protein|nr:DUF2807 domain-containing protein [Treponema sp.]